jgi:hypothetical protein
MASSSKKQSKASVNASSFFDLKAELSKHEDAFAKSKRAGKGRAEPIVGGVKRADKVSRSLCCSPYHAHLPFSLRAYFHLTSEV